MAKNLKTEFKRIGRSGPTVDGRVIEPEALRQAAKNYSKDTFTALIWPEHERWYNMGTVEALRAVDNHEGGVDLFAVIAPNGYYKSVNSADQKLFTSMELMPNFRDSGEYYLTGLAATDQPASAGTQEMRFSALNNDKALLSVFTEQTPLPEDDQPPSWFSRLFTQNKTDEDAMSKQALEALTAKFTALEEKLDAVIGGNGSGADDNDKNTESEDYAALAKTVNELTEKFTALEAKLADNGDKTDDKNADQYAQLRDELKKLRADFTQAVNEANGTDGGEHLGDTDDSSNYL